MFDELIVQIQPERCRGCPFLMVLTEFPDESLASHREGGRDEAVGARTVPRADVGAAAGVAAITALGRHGQPADIGDVVAFFASDDGRWVTGQVLEVNGGLWLGPSSR